MISLFSKSLKSIVTPVFDQLLALYPNHSDPKREFYDKEASLRFSLDEDIYKLEIKTTGVSSFHVQWSIKELGSFTSFFTLIERRSPVTKKVLLETVTKGFLDKENFHKERQAAIYLDQIKKSVKELIPSLDFISTRQYQINKSLVIEHTLFDQEVCFKLSTNFNLVTNKGLFNLFLVEDQSQTRLVSSKRGKKSDTQEGLIQQVASFFLENREQLKENYRYKKQQLKDQGQLLEKLDQWKTKAQEQGLDISYRTDNDGKVKVMVVVDVELNQHSLAKLTELEQLAKQFKN